MRSERELRYLDATEWTDEELLAALRKRYDEPVIPRCRMCGAELEVASAGGGNVRYACSMARPPRPDWALHYEQSTFETSCGDDRVIELCRRFEAAHD